MAPGDVVGLPLASCGLPLPYLGSAASQCSGNLALALHCQCSGKRQLETELNNNCIGSGRTWNSPQANLCKWWIDRALDCSRELDNKSITFYFVNWGPRLNLLFTFDIKKGRKENQKKFKWYFETLLSVGGELPWETSLVASLFMGELSVEGSGGGIKIEHTIETQFKSQLSSKKRDQGQGREKLCDCVFSRRSLFVTSTATFTLNL